MIQWLLDMLRIQGPVAAAIGALTAVTYRHISRDEDRSTALEERLRQLEMDRVTKHDLEQVSNQIAENQRTLLLVLTGKPHL